MFRQNVALSLGTSANTANPTPQPSQPLFGAPSAAPAPFLRPSALPPINTLFPSLQNGQSIPDDGRRRDVLMCVPAVRGSTEQSFEELRVSDYIRAYSSTGRPPAPCPQEPAGEQARAALGLPALFVPHVEIVVERPPELTASISDMGAGISIGESSQASSSTAADGLSIQVLKPVRTDTGDVLQSITCHPDYNSCSFEELRYRAYLHQNIFPSVSAPPMPPQPLSQPQPLSRTIQIPPLPTFQPTTFAVDGNDLLQSLSCAPAFSKHSPEELRIGYLFAKRELTSAELMQPSGQPIPAQPQQLHVLQPAFGTRPFS